jgi:hypothetical protein
LGIQNYSLLKGDPQPGNVTGANPHFRIPVKIPSGMATIDVNVQSVDGSEVLYAAGAEGRSASAEGPFTIRRA